jgi:hypothetical protein
VKREDISLTSFAGQWVGETQGEEMSAHLWSITQEGTYLWIETRWEGETRTAFFRAELVPSEPAFKILDIETPAQATLLDSQHFVISDWSWPHRKNPDGTKASLDVIFSRPGIAELTTRQVYLQSLGKTDSDDKSD